MYNIRPQCRGNRANALTHTPVRCTLREQERPRSTGSAARILKRAHMSALFSCPLCWSGRRCSLISHQGSGTPAPRAGAPERAEVPEPCQRAAGALIFSTLERATSIPPRSRCRRSPGHEPWSGTRTPERATPSRPEATPAPGRTLRSAGGCLWARGRGGGAATHPPREKSFRGTPLRPRAPSFVRKIPIWAIWELSPRNSPRPWGGGRTEHERP